MCRHHHHHEADDRHHHQRHERHLQKRLRGLSFSFFFFPWKNLERPNDRPSSGRIINKMQMNVISGTFWNIHFKVAQNAEIDLKIFKFCNVATSPLTRRQTFQVSKEAENKIGNEFERQIGRLSVRDELQTTGGPFGTTRPLTTVRPFA